MKNVLGLVAVIVGIRPTGHSYTPPPALAAPVDVAVVAAAIVLPAKTALAEEGVAAESAAADLIAANSARGLAFEAKAIQALAALKNKQALTVEGLGRSVPDILLDSGVVEIKDVVNVTFTRQLQNSIGGRRRVIQFGCEPSDPVDICSTPERG